MIDTPLGVLVRCPRCQRPLTMTGPLCKSCAAWLYKADPIYSHAMMDAAVSAERERCAKIADEWAKDTYYNTAEEIAREIREGK